MRGSNPRPYGRGGRHGRPHRGFQRGRGQPPPPPPPQQPRQHRLEQQQQHQQSYGWEDPDEDKTPTQATFGAQATAPNPYVRQGLGQHSGQQPYSYPAPLLLPGQAHTTYASTQPIRTAYATAQPTGQHPGASYNNNAAPPYNTYPSHTADFGHHGDDQTQVVPFNPYAYQQYYNPNTENVLEHFQYLNTGGNGYQIPPAAPSNLNLPSDQAQQFPPPPQPGQLPQFTPALQYGQAPYLAEAPQYGYGQTWHWAPAPQYGQTLQLGPNSQLPHLNQAREKVRADRNAKSVEAPGEQHHPRFSQSVHAQYPQDSREEKDENHRLILPIPAPRTKHPYGTHKGWQEAPPDPRFDDDHVPELLAFGDLRTQTYIYYKIWVLKDGEIEDLVGGFIEAEDESESTSSERLCDPDSYLWTFPIRAGNYDPKGICRLRALYARNPKDPHNPDNYHDLEFQDSYYLPKKIYAYSEALADSEVSEDESVLLAADPSTSRPSICVTPPTPLRPRTTPSSQSASTRSERQNSPAYETADDFLQAINMMPSQGPHMYSHQQGSGHFHNEPNWMHHPQQQGGHHVGAQQQQQGGHPGHMNHPGHAGHPHAGGAQQQGLYPRTGGGSGGGSHGQQVPHQGGSDSHIPGIEVLTDDHRRLLQWVHELLEDKNNKREPALMELSKKREQVPELALILWHTFGVMTALTHEILAVYPMLNPSQLTAAASNRVCNALALLQCVASHNDTRQLFLNAHLPLFLYPFLNTTSKSRPFEYLRLTSLGVIGALVKNDSTEVINFLLTTEIIPLCLRIMETGSELSKTVAIFIVQKILLDDLGLGYICHTYERFYAVGTVLSNMVQQLVEQQTVRLLKHVVRCFLRLSDNARAREALRQCLPEPLRDATFSPVLRDDAATKRCLAQLLINLSDNIDNAPPPGQQNPNMQ